MKNLDKINELNNELIQIESTWEKLIADRRNGYYFSISSKDLGIREVTTERYKTDVKRLRKEIRFLVAEEIKNISNALDFVSFELPLYDYNIPFRVEKDFEESDAKLELKIMLRCLEGLLKNRGFKHISEEIKKEEGFFNQNNVMYDGSKFKYKHALNRVKRILTELNLYSESGVVKITAKLIKKEIEAFLEALKDYSVLERYDFERKLRGFIKDAINKPDLDKTLLELGGKKRLRKNILYIESIRITL